MIRVRELTFVAVCILLGTAIVNASSNTTWLNGWLLRNVNDHLGAEYDCIARAMRAGRGFADPFQVESGPTAWVAPVLPCVLAGLYWLSGEDRGRVVEIVLALKGLVLLWSGGILFSEARRLRLIG